MPYNKRTNTTEGKKTDRIYLNRGERFDIADVNGNRYKERKNEDNIVFPHRHLVSTKVRCPHIKKNVSANHETKFSNLIVSR